MGKRGVERSRLTYLEEFLLLLQQRHPLGKPGGAITPPSLHHIRDGQRQRSMQLLHLRLVMLGHQDGPGAAVGKGALVPCLCGTQLQEAAHVRLLLLTTGGRVGAIRQGVG